MPPGERGSGLWSSQTGPVRPGMNRIMSAANSPPSVTTLSASKRTILWPRCVPMPRRRISFSRWSTALSPSRLPGRGEGLKNTSWMRSRRPSRRSCSSMPNRNSNIGPPRTALCSFGLAPKPTAIVPCCMVRRRSRICSAAAMPSHGVMACSMPGSLRMKRPPEATIRPSVCTMPLLVCTVRASSDRPVTCAATCSTCMRRKKFSSGTISCSRVRRPAGIQMVPGR